MFKKHANRISQQYEYYSKEYKKYEEKVYELDKARVEKVYNIISSQLPGKILEIGCLSGLFLIKLREIGWECYGIELSKSIFKAKKSGLKVIQCDVEYGIPFRDNIFDIVYAGEIIEHIYDTDYFLEEIRRVLKPQGKLIITTPNIACLTNRILLLFGGYPRYLEYNKHGAGHIHLYNKDKLKKQLEKNKFIVIKMLGNFVSLPDPTPRKLIRNTIFKILGSYLPSLSENLIFIAIPSKSK